MFFELWGLIVLQAMILKAHLLKVLMNELANILMHIRKIL